MRILKAEDTFTSKTTLVIGNFDGVHIAHQAMIKAAQKTAEQTQTEMGVLSFTPHPRFFFNPDAPREQIATDNQKEQKLKALGIDFLGQEEFNNTYSQMTDVQFIENILINKYNAQNIFIGQNFRFGHNRSGTPETLKADSRFTTHIFEMQHTAGETISSTRIRKVIKSGDLPTAKTLLGVPWSIELPVIHGDKRGRTLGYPTANQDLGHYVRPPYGIYVSMIERPEHPNSSPLYGLTNIGIRPMYKVESPLVETFIFDFDDDLYGETLRIIPQHFLRPEMSFDCLEDLIQQMDQDTLDAKDYLTHRNLTARI